MTSAAGNSPLKSNLSETAHTTSKGKEITYEDLAKCTGSSRSLPARYLSRLEVFRQGGGIITDAKVNKILEKNGMRNLEKIGEQFKQEARNISKTATNINYSAKELKDDSKDLKRAGDLIKLFAKFKDESHDLYSNKNFLEKTKTKAADKVTRKEYTEPRELKEVNDAKFILSARASLEKQSPLHLLKTALWESKAHSENKDQLSQDFHSFLNKQIPYPTDKDGLKAVYQNFIGETLKKTERFQKNVGPYNEEAKAHKAKVENYLKPKINSLEVNVALMSAGLMSEKNNDLAQKLHNMDEKTLLTHNLQEERTKFETDLVNSIQKFIGKSSNWLEATAQLKELHSREFKGEKVFANLIKNLSMDESYEFLRSISAPEILNSKGKEKLDFMQSIYQNNVKNINIPEAMKKEIETSLNQLVEDVNRKNPEEIERLVEEKRTIFDKAGAEIMSHIKNNLPTNPNELSLGTAKKISGDKEMTPEQKKAFDILNQS